MTKIKHDAMVGMDADMCNIPENDSYNYHIMAYCKDVTGEILGTTPTQPNLLITHKNSMYMSGYWDSSSSVLSWRLLNLGDGTDILTTTTTTTTPKPTQYIISGTFDVRLYQPEMTLTDLNGNRVYITVEFEDEQYNDTLLPTYGRYVITTATNPVQGILRVKGRDSMSMVTGNQWAGQITLPFIFAWTYDSSTGDYSITRNFTSSILTTTTSTTTSTTTTTTPAPTSYSYTINVNSVNAFLSLLNVTVSNSQVPTRIVAGVASGVGWTFNFTMPVYASTGWKFVFTGTGSVDRKEYTATLTNQQFVGGVCTISSLILKTSSSIVTDLTIAPLSLDNPEDTNSLDDAINDYLNG